MITSLSQGQECGTGWITVRWRVLSMQSHLLTSRQSDEPVVGACIDGKYGDLEAREQHGVQQLLHYESVRSGGLASGSDQFLTGKPGDDQRGSSESSGSRGYPFYRVHRSFPGDVAHRR